MVEWKQRAGAARLLSTSCRRRRKPSVQIRVKVPPAPHSDQTDEEANKQTKKRRKKQTNNQTNRPTPTNQPSRERTKTCTSKAASAVRSRRERSRTTWRKHRTRARVHAYLCACACACARAPACVRARACACLEAGSSRMGVQRMGTPRDAQARLTAPLELGRSARSCHCAVAGGAALRHSDALWRRAEALVRSASSAGSVAPLAPSSAQAAHPAPSHIALNMHARTRCRC